MVNQHKPYDKGCHFHFEKNKSQTLKEFKFTCKKMLQRVTSLDLNQLIHFAENQYLEITLQLKIKCL